MKFANNDIYDGSWENDEFSGLGELEQGNGEIYVGEFLKGKKHGFGKCDYADGTIYHGQFEKGKKNGKGSIWFTNGEQYDGEFADDLFDGEGNYFYANGDTYQGKWNKGKYNKYGVIYYANGDKFSGQFWNGRKYGLGTLTHADGSVESGQWVGTKLKRTTAQLKAAQKAQSDAINNMRRAMAAMNSSKSNKWSGNNTSSYSANNSRTQTYNAAQKTRQYSYETKQANSDSNPNHKKWDELYSYYTTHNPNTIHGATVKKEHAVRIGQRNFTLTPKSTILCFLNGDIEKIRLYNQTLNINIHDTQFSVAINEIGYSVEFHQNGNLKQLPLNKPYELLCADGQKRLFRYYVHFNKNEEVISGTLKENGKQWKYDK